MSVWTEEELEYLMKNYEETPQKELASLLNKTQSAIKIKASRLGLKKKEKYFYKKNFFKEIETELQAYWLGFIYADGYVTNKKSAPNTYSLGIELAAKDISHLRNFNKDICGNVDVSVRRRESIYNGKTIAGDICLIRLYCSSLCEDLISHGCVKNKSLIVGKPIGVPDALMRDFIRGYFDGNGTVFALQHKNGRSYLRTQITSGSKNFVRWMSEYLHSVGFDNYICEDGRHAFKLHIKSRDCKSFLEYMYKNSSRYLKRKYDKYEIAVCEEDT